MGIPPLIKADIHVECTYVAFEPLVCGDVAILWVFLGVKMVPVTISIIHLTRDDSYIDWSKPLAICFGK